MAKDRHSSSSHSKLTARWEVANMLIKNDTNDLRDQVERVVGLLEQNLQAMRLTHPTSQPNYPTQTLSHQTFVPNINNQPPIYSTFLTHTTLPNYPSPQPYMPQTVTLSPTYSPTIIRHNAMPTYYPPPPPPTTLQPIHIPPQIQQPTHSQQEFIEPFDFQIQELKIYLQTSQQEQLNPPLTSPCEPQTKIPSPPQSSQQPILIEPPTSLPSPPQIETPLLPPPHPTLHPMPVPPPMPQNPPPPPRPIPPVAINHDLDQNLFHDDDLEDGNRGNRRDEDDREL